MLGFELDFWDYATFVSLALVGVAFLCIFVWLAGLPGRIAVARKHPDAEAVGLLGWVGILPTIYPWVQALIWAFKPTDIVDIRRYPREEAEFIDEEMARLSGKSPAPHSQAKRAAATPTRGAVPPAHLDASTSDEPTR
jgi:alpha-beta hydrolase superfamily lysophospholipase